MRHRATPTPTPRTFKGVCPTLTYTYQEKVAVPALYDPETGKHWGLWRLEDKSVTYKTYVFVN